MKKKYRIGYTSGVFDLLHIGHINILKNAKDQCDSLIVGVTTDDLCRQRKNKTPIFNEDDRVTIIKSIRYVDNVILQEDMDKLKIVKTLGCDVVFVGSDWKGTPSWNIYEKQFAELGVQVVYLPHTEGVSSSLLRERMVSNEKV